MQHPNMTAYRSIDDLKLLKKWFYLYNDNIDNRLKAVQKVKGLATRGKLPHGVEATSFLTTMVLNDDEHGLIDSNTLQLSYTMALIRFVNGLLDPFQQSNYAIPMHLLAKQLNLPTYFVELRHMGTHESLPSLDILRITCANALKWLLENFWNNIDDLDEGLGSTSKDPFREALNLRIQDIETKLEKYQVYNNLKTFKKIRKQDLDKVYELENEEDNVAIKYNRCVADIMTLASEDLELLFDILFFKDYLIYPSIKVKEKKSKFNPLIVKLYRPLLDKLGIDCKLQCFNKIINIIENKPRDPIETRLFKKLAFSELSHPDETIQLVEWLLYFGQELSKSDTIPKEFENKDSLISKILDELESIEKQVPESIFSSFTNVLDNLLEAISKEEILQSLVERLGNWIKLIKNLQATKNTYELPPSLDDLLGFDPSPTSKRTLDDKSNHESDFKKQRPSNNNEIFLLTSHNNWKPTPFGSCV